MKYYEIKFKEEVAKYCCDHGINKTIRKYDLARCVINDWAKKFKNGESLEYKRRHYTNEFKDKAVNEARKTSFEEVVEKYDLKLCTLIIWSYTFGFEEEEEEAPEMNGPRWHTIDGLNGYYK